MFDTSLWPQRAFMRRVTRGVPSPLRGLLALLQPCRALRATPPAQIGPLIAGVGVATVLYGTKLLLEANASGKVQAAVQQAAEGMRRAAAERQAASEKAAAEASRTASRDRAQPDAAGASTADAYFTTAVKLQTSRPSGNGIYESSRQSCQPSLARSPHVGATRIVPPRRGCISSARRRKHASSISSNISVTHRDLASEDSGQQGATRPASCAGCRYALASWAGALASAALRIEESKTALLPCCQRRRRCARRSCLGVDVRRCEHRDCDAGARATCANDAFGHVVGVFEKNAFHIERGYMSSCSFSVVSSRKIAFER